MEVIDRNKSLETNLINTAGNHDIGYAKDNTEKKLQRFERLFGKVDWAVRFALPERYHNYVLLTENDASHDIRIVALNFLNLDTPALNGELQLGTCRIIDDVLGQSRPVEDRDTSTILLIHLPLPMETGICVGSLYFDFRSGDDGRGVKEQNNLSYRAGKGILEGIYGMSGYQHVPSGGFGRNDIILGARDHKDCDVLLSLRSTPYRLRPEHRKPSILFILMIIWRY